MEFYQMELPEPDQQQLAIYDRDSCQQIFWWVNEVNDCCWLNVVPFIGVALRFTSHILLFIYDVALLTSDVVLLINDTRKVYL